MTGSRRRDHRPSRPSRGFLLALYGLIVVETVAIVVLVVLLVQASTAASAAPRPAAGEGQQPAAQKEDEPADPASCEVGFEGADEKAVTESPGSRFSHLPIPREKGKVFAGWYPSADAATDQETQERVNGADVVECEEGGLTLHAAWLKPEEVAAADVGVPILMYHQFTANPGGEDNSLRLNYAYIGDFDAHMGYLAEQHFYLPTWDELSAFIDGELYLPPRSAIVTDDDAHATWLDLAVPVIDKYGLLSTSFVITKWRQDPTPSMWVQQRSHTDDMHEAGDNGKGRMVNWPAADIAADLERSAEILGAAEVLAYPFGHYNDTAKQGVADAGYEMAVTIEEGYVRAGADKLALPRMRVNYGDDLNAFIGMVG